MKALGWTLVVAAFAAAAVLMATERPVDPLDGPLALVTGVGLALVTTQGIREGEIRGHQRRIRRDAHPAGFWVAAAAWGLASLAMLAGGVALW